MIIKQDHLIEWIKGEARIANQAGNQKLVAEMISWLDKYWKDDSAARAFYTELEQTAPKN